MSVVQVHIEHWLLKVPFPLLQSKPNRVDPTRFLVSASFEITVNDVLVFSKLVNGNFPNEQAVIEQIRNASRGQQPISIT
ncbi:hypothetical protein P879_04011 [Paragonimus westermani]|uniref:Selenoprotein W-related protein n=1 Tax=Paragonimus westermani TaxID=34504 RepID=A0A8T0DNE7_9TREM|nr:hypothetical protein P879_04011 [Paragonimus westermani]